MPIIARCAPSRQRPPRSATSCRRASSQACSESISTPSRSKTTASITRPGELTGPASHGHRELTLLGADHRGVAAADRQQLLVVPELGNGATLEDRDLLRVTHGRET